MAEKNRTRLSERVLFSRPHSDRVIRKGSAGRGRILRPVFMLGTRIRQTLRRNHGRMTGESPQPLLIASRNHTQGLADSVKMWPWEEWEMKNEARQMTEKHGGEKNVKNALASQRRVIRCRNGNNWNSTRQHFFAANLFQKLPPSRRTFGAELEQLLWQIQETACTGCAQRHGMLEDKLL